MTLRLRLFALAVVMALPGVAQAEPLRILTAGAFKQVLAAVLPPFQAQGHEVAVDNDTVGALVKRIRAGEIFDLVIASPAALAELGKAGKISDETIDLARVGVGVAIREGAVKPDLGSVDAFKRVLLAARAVAYIDPASGGSSGIYVAGLIDRLGIGAEVRAKSVLVHGGYSAERVASGEADVAVQQISEILPVKGVALAGPLPREIQNYTVYSAAIALNSGNRAAALALIDLLRSRASDAVITGTGMEPLERTR